MNEMDVIFNEAVKESLEKVEVESSTFNLIELTLRGFYKDILVARIYQSLKLHPGLTYCRLEQNHERQKTFIYINKFKTLADVTLFFKIVLNVHKGRYEYEEILELLDVDTSSSCSLLMVNLKNYMNGFTGYTSGIFKLTEPGFSVNDNAATELETAYFLLLEQAPSWRELNDELLKKSFTAYLLLNTSFRDIRIDKEDEWLVSVQEFKSKLSTVPLYVKSRHLTRLNAFDEMEKDMWTSDPFCMQSLTIQHYVFSRVFAERSFVVTLKNMDTKQFYVAAAIVMRERETKERLLCFYRSYSRELWFGEKKHEVKTLVKWLEDNYGCPANYKRSEFIFELNKRL